MAAKKVVKKVQAGKGYISLNQIKKKMIEIAKDKEMSKTFGLKVPGTGAAPSAEGCCPACS